MRSSKRLSGVRAEQLPLRRLLHSGPAISYTCTDDAAVTCIFQSDNVEEQFGYPASRFLEEPGLWISRVHPDDKARYLDALRSVRRSGAAAVTYRFRHAEGDFRRVRDQMRFVPGREAGQGQILGWRSDITLQELTESVIDTVRASAEQWSSGLAPQAVLDSLTARLGVRYAILAEAGEEGTGKLLAVSKEGRPWNGFTCQFEDSFFAAVMEAGAAASYERAREQFPRDKMLSALEAESFAGVRLDAADGAPLGVLAVAHSGKLRHAESFVGALRIIGTLLAARSALNKAELEEQRLTYLVRRQGFYDPLTELPNRTLLLDHLVSLLRHDEEAEVCLIAVEMDRFHTLGGGLGHLKSDALVRELAVRLRRVVPSGDLVARLGEDRFAVVLAGLDRQADALSLAGQILREVEKPVDLDGSHIVVTASAGMAFGKGKTLEARELLHDAGVAVNRAKARGGNVFRVYDARAGAKLREQLQWEEQMRRALDRGEFELHYQPIICLQTGYLQGFEALARWRHPQKGLLAPNVFLAGMEETGLVERLSWWAMGQAVQQMVQWRDGLGIRGLYVSVNMAAQQLVRPELPLQIASILAEQGLDPEHLRLELTETLVMRESDEVSERLRAVQAMGVGLMLDDFGTGYSSLSRLGSLPIQALKIDQSFVRGLQDGRGQLQIVRLIIDMARDLRMEVVAEGIETATQAQLLREMGCHHGQGYFLLEPLEPGERERLFRAAGAGAPA